MSEKPKPLQALADALADAHLRAERFRAGTGIWPYETPAEWYAAAVELFGVAILERPLAQVQLLVEGELTRRRSAAAAADAEPAEAIAPAAKIDDISDLSGNSRSANRDPKREIQKKFTPYVYCLLHRDPWIQQAAAELNRIGKPRGKTEAIINYFNSTRPAEMATNEARGIIERMKKYEQKKRAEAGN
jgi:hypothetical protein